MNDLNRLGWYDENFYGNVTKAKEVLLKGDGVMSPPRREAFTAL